MRRNCGALRIALVLGLIGADGIALTRSAAGQEPDHVLAIVGGTVIAAPGAAPTEDGVVVVEGGRIAAFGPRREVPVPESAEILDASGATVLAGFWNVHVHFADPGWMGADTLPGDRLRARLEAMLNRWGFTRVVDTGSFLANTLALRRRIDVGELPGPAILTAGVPFVPPGGTPFYVRPLVLPEIESAAAAADSAEARLAAGADLIKVFAGSPVEPGAPAVLMPRETLAAVVRAAHANGRIVAAHPTSREGASRAAEAGVDLLLHTTPDEGGEWDPAFAHRLVERGVALAPTLDLWRWVLERGGAQPDGRDAFQATAVGQLAAFAAAGGRVVFGTDVGFTDAFDPTAEYRGMERAGLDFDAILAALTTAPATLFGFEGRTGRIEPGLAADLVVVEGDPREDIAALARVRATITGGRIVYRNP
jgi:imidazolonepropionase-like amidohydrolase